MYIVWTATILLNILAYVGYMAFYKKPSNKIESLIILMLTIPSILVELNAWIYKEDDCGICTNDCSIFMSGCNVCTNNRNKKFESTGVTVCAITVILEICVALFVQKNYNILKSFTWSFIFVVFENMVRMAYLIMAPYKRNYRWIKWTRRALIAIDILLILIGGIFVSIKINDDRDKRLPSRKDNKNR